MNIQIGQVKLGFKDGLLHINSNVLGLPITVWASRNTDNGQITLNVFSNTTVLLSISPEENNVTQTPEEL